VTIERFRAIEELTFAPGPRTVILGPQNAGKSTVLEALDLLLHHGIGRPRPSPTEIDYFGRDPSAGFQVEAVIGDISNAFLPSVNRHLEGWNTEQAEVVAEPDGESIEPVVRVRVVGTPDGDVMHEFAKPESEGARFGRAYRSQLGWVFDGRQRDPARQLAFYQGGLLERLFGGTDELGDAVDNLKDALGAGADAVNADAIVSGVLDGLADDLRGLGLLGTDERPEFEIGAVSQRDLLQSLRLALPAGDVHIPLSRQGRGAQRLLLVSVMLRLAQAGEATPIGGFEEPEEALEPLRQAQLADMLIKLASGGGQIFVVTHSPEIARAFEIDDFLLLQERAGGANARLLRSSLTPPVRQSYERWLDGAVVRGLFSHVPILVEGPGDRAALAVFWSALAEAGDVKPASQLGVDFVNCEGFRNMAMLAAVLDEAGKSVAAWVEQDQEAVRYEANRLRAEGHVAALVSHEAVKGRQNLEQAIACGCNIAALSAALDAISADRGYEWQVGRETLLSHLGQVEGVEAEQREAAKETESTAAFLGCFDEQTARSIVASALAAKTHSPFDMKGARQARIVAETVTAADGVPDNFATAIRAVAGWVEAACVRGAEFSMGDDPAQN
jgi:energy-coupling factor transporter ATP-binding protein EcfA2